MKIQASDIDVKQRRIRSMAAFLRDAAHTITAIKPVVKSFDGKTYTKRFDEAIEAVKLPGECHVRVCHEYGGTLSIKAYRPPFYGNYQTLLYVYDCIASNRPSKYYSSDMIVFDGKKINAGHMVGLLNARYDELLKKAATYDQTADDLPSTLDHAKQAERLLYSCVMSVPYELRELSGIYI